MNLFNRLQARFGSDPRFARVLHGSLSGLASRGFTLLINILTLPLTVRYLGRFQYGIWVTISTSVMMLAVLDLGVANTLTNFIAEAHAKEDRAQAKQSFATAFWVTVAIVLLLAPLSFALWRALNWGSLFHVEDPLLVEEVRRCVAIAGVFFLLSMPLTLANRVLGGYQEVHLANYFGMANSVLSLIAIIGTVWLHGSLVTLMAAYSGALLFGTLGLNLWLCFWQRPWLRPSPWNVSRGIIRKLFGQGFLFFIIQLTGLVVFNSDNLVITHYLGAAAVTPYSTAWKLTQYAALLQGVLMPSLWPALAEAYHQRNMSWINSTYRSLRKKTQLAVGVVAVLMGLLGQWVIRVWTGGAIVPNHRLLWLMAFFAFLMAVTTNQALLLAAVGRLRLEAVVAVLAAVSNFVLSIYLVQRIGAEGVILATILSFAIFMVVPQAWEVRRILRGHYLEPQVDRFPNTLRDRQE